MDRKQAFCDWVRSAWVAVLFLWLLGAVPAVAQQLTTVPVCFSYLSVNEGLSSNTVRSLLQDKYGFVWVGTGRGLNRYDGHKVVHYPKTNALCVTALCEVGDSIWIGTENGLFLYLQALDSICKYETSGSNVKYLTEKILTKESFSTINVADMCADEKGNVWVASLGDGIVRVSDGGKCVERVSTPGGDNVYGRVFIDSDGGVWATTNWSDVPIVLYDERRNAFVPYRLEFDGGFEGKYNSIALTQAEDGTMWLATADGYIIRYDGSSGRAAVVATPRQTRIGKVHSIVEVKKDNLLIGSDNGLLLYSVTDGAMRNHTSLWGMTGELSDNFIYPIMTDREHGTWIGTYYGGVNYFHPTTSDFTSHTANSSGNSVRGNVINHFAEDRHGRLWIASDDGGLTMYDPEDGSFRAVGLANAGVHNAHALCILGEKLYVGTYSQGMDIVDLNTFEVRNVARFCDEDGRVIDASSYEMFADNRSRLWVGTFKAILIFNEATGTFRVMRSVDSPVVDILQTKDGTMWFVTESSGLLSYVERLGEWKLYEPSKLVGEADGMQGVANCVYLDEAGVLWAGTSKGLMRFNSAEDRFELVPLMQSPVNVIAIEDDGDDMWLATSVGLCRYSEAEGKVGHLFKAGGNLVSTDFLPAAMLRTKSGVIYVGTTQGFVSFNPREMHHNEVAPKVMFTGLEILNRPVAVGSELLPKSLNMIDELRLSYRENVVRIFFSAMSYIKSSDNVYSYYLEGFDSDWIDGGNHHSVTYTNLAPGTYTLHVRAANNDGVYSDDTVLRIVVTPPFYWNPTAQLIYALLIVVLIVYIMKRMMKKAEKRHVAEIHEIKTQKEEAIQKINTQKEQEIHEITTQKEQAIQEITTQKELEIQEINIQKELEIQEINIQKEQEVHDARIKFMTITPRDQEFLDKLEEVIEANFANPDLTVDAIASAVGISRTGLFTKLKTLADVTPNEMIQVIRLKHAASLLQEKQYRVSEVCYMVGFSSPSYFAKCFQKQYGVTPAKYE